MNGAFELTISCGVADSRRHRTRHRMVVGRDWTVETEHDLEAERVAAAFGGREVTCLAFTDRVLPAVRSLVESRGRSVIPPIVQVGSDAFVPVIRPAGCDCARRALSLEQCGGHLRKPSHWARVYGARLGAVTQTLAQMSQRGWIEEITPSADEVEQAGALLVGLDPVRHLWQAGIHPAQVIALHARLDPRERDGSPGMLRPWAVVKALINGGLRQDWVEALRGLDPIIIEACIRSRPLQEGLDPGEIRRWTSAGADPHSASTLIRAGWSVEDLIQVARDPGPMRFHTALIASRWVIAGAVISPEEYREIYADPDLSPHAVPRAETIDAVRRRTGDRLVDVSNVAIARELVRAGSVQGAVVALVPITPSSARPEEPA